jgi:putative oxidoreductase
MNDLLALGGRLLLAMLFVLGALQKLDDPAPAMDLLTARGLPAILIWPALLFNGIAGIALFAGYRTRAFALLAAAYCAATSYFHFLPDDPWQMSIFVKNWTIAGGFLVLAAHGPGRYSWDRA